MPRLQHFELGLCTLKLEQREINEIFDHLIVFINNLDRTLVTLSISSRRSSLNLDLARAFTYLGTFPRLQKFSLTIPYDGRHLSCPSKLVQFLEKHRDTLHDLQLGTNPSSPAISPTPIASKYWIFNILAATRTPYPHLSTVGLALRPLRADLAPVIEFLAQHAGQLEHLNLTDRALEYIELEAILHSLGTFPGLKRFKVRLSCLNSAFLGLLALRLPQLASLELTFSEVKAFAAPRDFAGDTAARVLYELRHFVTEVRGDRADYAQWELSTIGVSYARPNNVHQSIHDDHLSMLSHALLDSIPALQDFIKLPPLHDY